MKRFATMVAACGLALAAGSQARATLLYDNGPPSGQSEYNIYGGFGVSDSFTLGSAADLTTGQAAIWVTNYGSPVGVQVSIGTSPFGSDVFNAFEPLSNTFEGTRASAFFIYESQFSLAGVHLGAGSYWLTLQNGVSSNLDGFVGWDINYGPSAAYDYSTMYPVPSESFQIYGNNSPAAPEPSSLVLLGMAGLGMGGYAWLRRKAGPAAA